MKKRVNVNADETDALVPEDPRSPERKRRIADGGFHTASAVELLKATDLTTWDVLKTQKRSWLAALVGAYAGFLFGIDQGYIGPILGFDSFKKEFGTKQGESSDYTISDSLSGIMVSIFSIGALITALPFISGPFCDGLGRKWTVFIGGLVFAVGAVLQATSSSLAQFLIGRFIGGCALGILCTTVPMYMSEVSPKETRGFNGMFFQFMVVFGILIAAIIDLILQDTSDHDWRIAIYPQIGFGVLLSVGALTMWESPRYLYSIGKKDEAKKVLDSLRKGAPFGYVDTEWADMQQELESNHSGTWAGLKQPFMWRITVIAMLCQFFQQFTGINAFMYYGSRIGTAIGANGTTVQLIINAVNMVSVLPAFALVEVVGRSKLLKWGAVGMGGSLIIGAIIGSSLVHPNKDGCFQDGWAACICTVQSEADWTSKDFVTKQGQTIQEYCADQVPDQDDITATSELSTIENGVTMDVLLSFPGYDFGNPTTLPTQYLKYCRTQTITASTAKDAPDGFSKWVDDGPSIFEHCAFTNDYDYPITGAPGKINKVTGWTIVAMVLLFVFFFEISWGPVPWIYTVEIAPQNYRAKISGLCTFTNWASAAAIGYLTPALVTAINFYSFLFFAGFCVLAFFYGWFVPESAGFPLEKMHWKFERFFGVLYEDGHTISKHVSMPQTQTEPLHSPVNVVDPITGERREVHLRVTQTEPGRLADLSPNPSDDEEDNDENEA